MTARSSIFRFYEVGTSEEASVSCLLLPLSSPVLSKWSFLVLSSSSTPFITSSSLSFLSLWNNSYPSLVCLFHWMFVEKAYLPVFSMALRKKTVPSLCPEGRRKKWTTHIGYFSLLSWQRRIDWIHVSVHSPMSVTFYSSWLNCHYWQCELTIWKGVENVMCRREWTERKDMSWQHSNSSNNGAWKTIRPEENIWAR